MSNQVKSGELARNGESKGPPGLPVHIKTARLDARDIAVGEVLVIDELRLAGGTIDYLPGGALRIDALEATLVVTEAAFNKFLSRNTEEPLSEMEVALLNGKMRISGRYRMLLPIPFTVTAVPEIEGGARLRLDSRHISLIGAPIPGFGVEMIGEKINAQLAQVFDANNLPVPVRLTRLTVETGRIVLEATTTGPLHLSGK